MKLKRNIITFITIVFALVAFSVVVVAQDSPEAPKDGAERTKKDGRMGGRKFAGEKGRSGKRGFRGRRGGMIRGLSKLDLSEPQRSQIKTMIETHKNGQMPFHEEMRGLKMKMRDGSATEGDKTRFDELRAASRESAEQLKTSILGILTPEQVQKLEQMKAERQLRMQERRQRWMERKQKAPESVIKQDG